MKKILLTLAVAAFISCGAFAQQSATDGVKQAINTLFDGMRKGDSALIRTVFAKEMVLQSVSSDKAGKTVISVDSADDFARAIGTPHNAVYDERITFNDIKIDGDLASVWAPYKFYVGDKFSHCGVDVFSLMKTASGWKIIYIVDTRRKDNCIE
ncbi:MAG: nuclear transport factor 2 family protein [Mucilaginibacter sp.]|uniref:nuclear transport factor 2 family protein n=1 Tax=Mucilaginibacter sp. L3T2-6 TaxID=3062491 RepID=UPI0026749AA4|nr:nuclear transport factor 2 family protein [Mucilaginibacter sp. L3T2-6]MDO3644574.1 nuclear transport factor 2 family protein [Mucilaginibacter sp. L3T2-6]MDV6217054.1 nuclear transport factor 2 family protein [Mucilaginibacter sp. L3T2-6]